MPKLEVRIPEKIIESKFTHTISAGSNIYTNLPVEYELERPKRGKKGNIYSPERVMLLEDYIGFNGLYCKLQRVDYENAICYSLRSNITANEEFTNNHHLLTMNEAYIPPQWPEKNTIDNWDTGLIDTSQFDLKTRTFYCCVETIYDGEGITNEQITQFAKDSLFKGIKIILKANAKKSTDDYILHLIQKYYFFASVDEWSFKVRPCSNLYTLVTIPEKYLTSTDIIDYRTNTEEARKDGLTSGVLDPRVGPDQIKHTVRFDMITFSNFKDQIDWLVSLLESKIEGQLAICTEAADEYIGALDYEDYLDEIGLDLRDEKYKFNYIDNPGNFITTIRLLLEINGVPSLDDAMEDAAPTSNNIFFGLDENFNIIYIDVVRGGRLIPFYTDGYVFDNPLGEYGVVDQRGGHLIYQMAHLRTVFNDNPEVTDAEALKTLAMNCGYTQFVEKFIKPPPREVNLPKRDWDCAVNNMKRLWQSGIIKTLNTSKEVLEISEYNIRKQRSLRNKQGAEFSDIKRKFDKNAQAAATADVARTAREDPSLNVLDVYWPDDEMAANFKSRGIDLSKPLLTGWNELKKICRSTSFQRALLKRIICWVKDASNTQFASDMDKLINNETKKSIQEFLKNVFCSPFMDKLLKGLEAYKVPKFKPLDLNRALREAMANAIVQALVEIWNIAVAEIIASLANCGKEDPPNPDAEDDFAKDLDDALNDLLEGSDNPLNSSGLGDAFSGAGIPLVGSTPENDAEREKAKQSLKDLMSDLTCILNAIEICRLMTEGIMSQEVYGMIKSLLQRKYPELLNYLRTEEDIINFFLKMGNAMNMVEMCKKLLSAGTVLPDGCVCDPGELEKSKRDALAKNNLTPDQIDDLIDDAEKKRQKRLDDLLNALENAPETLPLVCDGTNPGKVNVAMADSTYADMVDQAIEGAIGPLYEIFNSDLKEYAKNMIKSQVFEFTPQELQEMTSTGNSEEDGAKLREMLIRKKILVPVYENGTTTDDHVILEDGTRHNFEPKYTIKKNEDGTTEKTQDKNFFGSELYVDDRVPVLVDGEPLYEFNTNVPRPPPIVAPLLQDSLNPTITPNYFQQIDNTLSFKVNNDNERESFKALLRLQAEVNVNEAILAAGDEFMGKLYMQITVELAKIAAELIEKFALDQGSFDDGFWTGWSTIDAKYNGRGTYRLWVKIPALIIAVYQIFDVFLVDFANKSTSGETNAANMTVGFTGGVRSPPRSTAANVSPDSYPVNVRTANENLDIVASNSNGVSVGSTSGNMVSYASETDLYMAYLNAQERVLVNTRDAYNAEMQAAGPYSVNNIEAQVTQYVTSTTMSQEQIDSEQRNEEVLNGNQPMTMTSAFDAAETYMSDISADLATFENSVTFKAFMNIINAIVAGINKFKQDCANAVGSRESAIVQLNNIDNNFPNYDIKYTPGLNENNDSKIEILKNGKPFILSETREYIEKDIDQYMLDNNLYEDYDGTQNLQEHIFSNYLKRKNLQSFDYKIIQKEMFDDLYHTTLYSHYMRLKEYPSGDVGPFLGYVRTGLKESATEEEKNCNIARNPLDLDEIKADVMNDFVNSNCNHEPPDPAGGKRKSMNPVETAISYAFMLATIRIYLYDYYLKGIFLFDRYKLGMTATDPLVDILASSFQVEMVGLGADYFSSMQDTIVSYCKMHYRSFYDALVAEYGLEQMSSQIVKRIFFKKVIREQILYLSAKINPKLAGITDTIETETNIPVPAQSTTIAGSVSNFFLNRNVSAKTLNCVVEGNNITCKLGDNILFSDLVANIKNNIEYRFLFEFCFPVRKYVGLVALHAMYCGNATVQANQTFTASKSFCKTRHNSTMQANGSNNNIESSGNSSTKNPYQPGSGDWGAAGTYMMALIIKTLIKTPLDILKHVCETGDINVFLASLPYKIAKPITLAILNQVPSWASNEYIANAPQYATEEEKEENPIGTMFTDMGVGIARTFYFIPVSATMVTPIIGGLLWGFCWLKPSTFGFFYYGLLLWTDELIENFSPDAITAVQSAAQRKAARELNQNTCASVLAAWKAGRVRKDNLEEEQFS